MLKRNNLLSKIVNRWLQIVVIWNSNSCAWTNSKSDPVVSAPANYLKYEDLERSSDLNVQSASGKHDLVGKCKKSILLLIMNWSVSWTHQKSGSIGTFSQNCGKQMIQTARLRTQTASSLKMAARVLAQKPRHCETNQAWRDVPMPHFTRRFNAAVVYKQLTCPKTTIERGWLGCSLTLELFFARTLLSRSLKGTPSNLPETG